MKLFELLKCLEMNVTEWLGKWKESLLAKCILLLKVHPSTCRLDRSICKSPSHG